MKSGNKRKRKSPESTMTSKELDAYTRRQVELHNHRFTQDRRRKLMKPSRVIQEYYEKFVLPKDGYDAIGIIADFRWDLKWFINDYSHHPAYSRFFTDSTIHKNVLLLLNYLSKYSQGNEENVIGNWKELWTNDDSLDRENTPEAIRKIYDILKHWYQTSHTEEMITEEAFGNFCSYLNRIAQYIGRSKNSVSETAGRKRYKRTFKRTLKKLK